MTNCLNNRACSLVLFFALMFWVALPHNALASGALTTAARGLVKSGEKLLAEGAEEGLEQAARRGTPQAARALATTVERAAAPSLRFSNVARTLAPAQLRVVERLLTQFGPEAIEASARLATAYGDDAVRVVQALGRRGRYYLEVHGKTVTQGLRLANKAGHGERYLALLARYGDRFVKHLDQHKLLYGGGAALTAFLVNPEPFVDATGKLAGTVAEKVVVPVGREIAVPVAKETLETGSRTVISGLELVLKTLGGFGLFSILACALLFRYGLRAIGEFLRDRDEARATLRAGECASTETSPGSVSGEDSSAGIHGAMPSATLESTGNKSEPANDKTNGVAAKGIAAGLLVGWLLLASPVEAALPVAASVVTMPPAGPVVANAIISPQNLRMITKVLRQAVKFSKKAAECYVKYKPMVQPVLERMTTAVKKLPTRTPPVTPDNLVWFLAEVVTFVVLDRAITGPEVPIPAPLEWPKELPNTSEWEPPRDLLEQLPEF